MVVACEATVMSAPTRVSQNGDTACFTETSEAPLPFLLFDQERSLPPWPAAAERARGAGPAANVMESMLSWLQSSLLRSMPFMTSSLPSASLASAASACADSDCASAAGLSGQTDCA